MCIFVCFYLSLFYLHVFQSRSVCLRVEQFGLRTLLFFAFAARSKSVVIHFFGFSLQLFCFLFWLTVP